MITDVDWKEWTPEKKAKFDEFCYYANLVKITQYEATRIENNRMRSSYRAACLMKERKTIDDLRGKPDGVVVPKELIPKHGRKTKNVWGNAITLVGRQINGHPVTAEQIRQKTGLGRATVYNQLKRLREAGLVVQTNSGDWLAS